ncbi:Cation efflux system protein CusA [Poriferisphaera corsica]|uniref:Cation efflux system protein CusA n=1 Tax=Poriferisphaera corsica TaxID=2528020 RepID=A0A517YS75_9BACT|nr:efflux RND transporter permease subunit [Poriferisphaera corsica]QDU33068.1 Cation efflux system protein CusA [Poriferisphaera corsica]
MNDDHDVQLADRNDGVLNRVIGFCIQQKLIVLLMAILIVAWGIMVAPFDWNVGDLPRDPVAVDAIPDTGENQQIIFTDWPGRSPQDIEDQITYPLTVSLLGVPGVKSVRSFSYFGFSTIFVIFNDDVDFYWSRSRLLEKLSSLPADTLPESTNPRLGPDATALGQVFWYTLEGRDPKGNPAGGWNLEELRSVQDWYVRYGLMSAQSVSEVASIGGYVREYQIDVDPDAMRLHEISLEDIFNTVRNSNQEVGARTIEVNRVEYLIRGVGWIKGVADLEKAVIKSINNVPITLNEVAHITIGPAERRGALDKGGAEAVGGVVVARFGENPLAAINNVKDKIEEISPGLPSKAVIDWGNVKASQVRQFADTQNIDGFISQSMLLNQDAWLEWMNSHSYDSWPQWLNKSTISIIPFYDRSELIQETLQTLNDALIQQVLITIIVVVIMVFHLRASLIISLTLPLAVLMAFIAMKIFHVDANIVALSGIAIAIGTVVDMGIVLTENILKRQQEDSGNTNSQRLVYEASTEVGGAVLTAVMTTIVSFLPVFTMIGSEGKLFKPLAFTKTFTLVASIIVALTIIPPLAHLMFFVWRKRNVPKFSWGKQRLQSLVKSYKRLSKTWFAIKRIYNRIRPDIFIRWCRRGINVLFALIIGIVLSYLWEPLGPESGFFYNLLFVVSVIGGLLLLFQLFIQIYPTMLDWCLRFRWLFLSLPSFILIVGLCVWLGFAQIFAFVPWSANKLGMNTGRVIANPIWQWGDNTFPGLGREFMPALDEGSFLLMPTTMPHASLGQALDMMKQVDAAASSVPEVKQVVGKIGRVDSPLDPAPIFMLESVVYYNDEYAINEEGKRVRQWRDDIRSPDDIWREIQKVTTIPGITGAPKLQPIEARRIMLESGFRAPMGIKVRGPDLISIEKTVLELESLLRQIPSIDPLTVNADRIVGKPYLEIIIDREAIKRYGLSIADVQRVIEVAVGGVTITRTVEGRERYGVRVRYLRELRDSPETLEQVLVTTPEGQHIPLTQLAMIEYSRGPQMIRSEDTFLVGYVTFGPRSGFAEVDVVEASQKYLDSKLANNELILPTGVNYSFAGNYENQIRANKTLQIVLPIALLIIFVILYLQFKEITTTLIVFCGIAVAWAGGFILIWLYGQSWFLDFDLLGHNMREVFQVRPINLSVAVWVGFLALFGIATDDGVVIATYLKQKFKGQKQLTKARIRSLTIEAGKRRVRPCLMTTATTVLALLPVLTATGRGADIMIPMAIPSVGGMLIELITMFIVPVLYCMRKEVSVTKMIDRTPQNDMR